MTVRATLGGTAKKKMGRMTDMAGKKRASFGQWIGILLFVLIGGMCGIEIMGYADHARSGGLTGPALFLSFVSLFACLYIVMLLQIIVHEAGHLVFGSVSGYTFVSFRISSFMWIKNGEKISFRRLSIAGTGGQCLMEPPDLKDGRIPVLLYNFGGSVFNLTAGAVCLSLSFIFPVHSYPWTVLFFSAVTGFAYALMNGLPLKMGPVNNDGKNALDLSRDPEAVRAFWIQMKVSALTARGVRLPDMPDEWFLVPSDESMKNGIIAVVGVLACSRLMEQHRFSEADILMARLLLQENGIVPLHRSLLACELKMMKAMKTYPSVLRTEYAYALLGERDRDAAAKIKAEFDKVSRSYPYPSEIASEQELMRIAEGSGRGLQHEE